MRKRDNTEDRSHISHGVEKEVSRAERYRKQRGSVKQSKRARQ